MNNSDSSITNSVYQDHLGQYIEPNTSTIQRLQALTQGPEQSQTQELSHSQFQLQTPTHHQSFTRRSHVGFVIASEPTIQGSIP